MSSNGKTPNTNRQHVDRTTESTSDKVLRCIHKVLYINMEGYHSLNLSVLLLADQRFHIPL